MQLRFPVVNVRSRRLGQTPTSTYGPPLGPGTTGVSPWDLKTMNDTIEPQTTTPESSDDLWSGKANAPKPVRPMPAPADIYVSNVLENPDNPDKPLPRFITEEEAAKAKNLTGLAVVGGTLVALVAAGMIAFR